jgi:putative oxidoreductase
MSARTTSVHVPTPRAPAPVVRRRRGLHSVIGTPADPLATVALLALGAMILPHGMQKVFGVFGGYGFAATMQWFTETMGVPWIFAFLDVLIESLGGLALLIGFGGRVAAAGVASVMVVAELTTHVPNGFFMNWDGSLPAGSEGWEFHMLAVALALIVMIRGSRAWSADRVLALRIGR